ncbi:hypothetical protein E5676_scaffold110G00370 [Cucumis melo var. makuwa]|uniref:Uncharacterized protein n=1 Tax=Cucumis melo var. makuwa TaxID=1194695 RepID=A0A5D3B8Z6_CUCMM|nr:hypothetical protein E5676_scaffold110G00370 [Cucumis melo var. makuwa]
MDIDMIRVIRRDPRSPIVLAFPLGFVTNQYVLGAPSEYRRPDSVPTGAHVARVWERARKMPPRRGARRGGGEEGRGAGRGQLEEQPAVCQGHNCPCLQCFLYDVFNYLLSLSRFIKTFFQEREGRLRHTASLTADSDFRTADLLIELSKCRTIVLRSYDCDKWYQSQVG